MESRWIRRDRTVAAVAKRSLFAYAWGAASRTDGRQLEAIDAKFEFREDFEPRVRGLGRSGCGVGTKYSGDTSAFCLGS